MDQREGLGRELRYRKARIPTPTNAPVNQNTDLRPHNAATAPKTNGPAVEAILPVVL
jgi:hypothetical protein